ncbi:MAG: DUF1361 domain-containing protein [Anaerolineae bacterium]|nr:DUF1361 domain-containing protein [Anaerolineae bacterium]
MEIHEPGRPVAHKMDLWLLQAVRRLHVFLGTHGFYPVALSTLLCWGLFGVRAYFSRSWIYLFLSWNLFLAWVPYLASLWTAHWRAAHPRRWWLLLPPAALSLAFFPNAPYIVTDFLHLTERAPIPLWYDIGLLTSFAWTGLLLGVYALRILQDIVKAWAGAILSWVFVLVVVSLSGMGVYIGRFLRWNSWDLVMQPTAILSDIAIRLRHPLLHPSSYGVTLLFSALMFVCYLALTAGPRSEEIH